MAGAPLAVPIYSLAMAAPASRYLLTVRIFSLPVHMFEFQWWFTTVHPYPRSARGALSSAMAATVKCALATACQRRADQEREEVVGREASGGVLELIRSVAGRSGGGTAE